MRSCSSSVLMEGHCCIEPECSGEAQQRGGSPSSKAAKKGSNHSTVPIICRLWAAKWRQSHGVIAQCNSAPGPSCSGCWWGRGSRSRPAAGRHGRARLLHHRGRHGLMPTRSDGSAPFGVRCWTGCSSSDADSCNLCWLSTPITTTVTVRIVPWDRCHHSGLANPLSSCRLGPSSGEIDSVG